MKEKFYKITDVDSLQQFPELSETMSEKDLYLFYLQNIDKTEYSTFVDWVADMKKSGMIETVKA